MRSKDQLAQVLMDVENEKAKVNDDEDEAVLGKYEENMEFMMIELDDLEPQFLNLILDTLEHYELYRLCLVICNRYHLQDKHGRYIAAICHKYSNLS